ncbi:unnamed protein product [Closterium sp. NIES-64]|nr:unnamed protein product [Closterium sp. NIES-64]
MEYPPRKIAIAIDLSDESAHAVIILHVRPTSLLYGADWGAWEATDAAKAADREIKERAEEEFDALTLAKARELAEPLKLAGIPFRVHIVKDHDMKERICLEVERLGVSACIMGSRGFGAHGRARKSRLGSVSDYCVHHCIGCAVNAFDFMAGDCPVVVVRMHEEKPFIHPPLTALAS